MEIKDLLTKQCIYDKRSHHIYLLNNNNLECQIDIRCWGESHIIQDEFGEWIADAINEKIKLENFNN